MSEIEFLTRPCTPGDAADLRRRLEVARRFRTGEYPQSAIGYVMARAWFGRN